MASWELKLKHKNGTEETIATCIFSDDADIIFDHYKKMNLRVALECTTFFGGTEIEKEHRWYEPA